MIKEALTLLAALAVSGTSAAPERPEREDSIYVLEGDLPRLEAFAANMAEWEGGELIEKDFEHRIFYFWAYSERTAPQARQFLMPVAFSGLKLEIQSYDQSKAYPKLRKLADQIAIDCVVRIDPFFIAPTGRVQFRPAPTTAFDQSECLLKGAMGSDDIKPVLDFVGNEKIAEPKSQ